MSEWVATETGVCVRDGGETVVRLRGDFEPEPRQEAARATARGPGEFHARTGAAAAGTATELELPVGPAAVRDGDTGAVTDLSTDAVELAAGDDPHELVVSLPRGDGAALRFGGPATVRRRDTGQVVVAFPDRRRIGLGRLDAGPASATVRAPPTPEGIAAVVSRSGSIHPTRGAGRSLVALRGHPPRIAFDEATAAPDGGRERGEQQRRDDETTNNDEAADDGVALRVPPAFDSLFAVAPLAYYLGARVDLAAGITPHLTCGGRRHDLDPVAESAPALLERVFWLDCLVREAGGPAAVAETDLLDRLDLGDATGLRTAPPVRRVARYLAADYGAVADCLPQWHLATYADPTAENARVLPALAARLSHVYPPVAHEVSGRELMERTLDDFYRADDTGDAGGTSTGPRTPVDLVDPELRRATHHGWLADGAPLEAYRAVPAAYDSAVEHSARSSPLRVTVVRNEPEMASEGHDAAAAYRADPDTAVRVEHDLTCDELRAVLDDGPDLLHYIGHCDEAGLRCVDGHLAAADLDRCRTRAAFLNACGSYHEGVDLVRRGAVAAGVTFRKVLDGQARTVGTTFARLFVAGYAVEQAVELARRRIVMGKDYAVVGDGTHTFHSPGRSPPPVLDVEAVDGDRYRVRCRAARVPEVGGTFCSGLPEAADRRLRGGVAEAVLDRSALAAHLERIDCPVRHEDGFGWSGSVAATLRSTGGM